MQEVRAGHNLFEYNDYREYLKDFYNSCKELKPSYSHRLFARQAGLSSPSHLLMIMNGDRNLSSTTIEKFSDGLKLLSKERRYFNLLVLYNQAKDIKIKSKYFAELIKLRAKVFKPHKIEHDKFEFLSKWYTIAIYVLMELKSFKSDPVWISKALREQVTKKQVHETVAVLTRLGLVKEDKNGKLVQTDGALVIPDDTKSMAVYNYHRSMNLLADFALKTNDIENREMNGVTVSLPKSKLPEIKEKIREFRREINRLSESYEDSDEIYQLNLQFFPLSKIGDIK